MGTRFGQVDLAQHIGLPGYAQQRAEYLLDGIPVRTMRTTGDIGETERSVCFSKPQPVG